MRQSLRHEIRALQRRLGITTIMVTHDQEEALAMADRIVVMNHGVVEQVGPPAEVYTRPRSPFVARFVGQMNFLAATAGARPGTARLGGAEISLSAGPARGRDGGAAAGEALTLAIRPEEIVVGPAARRRRPTASSTRIRSIQFLGSFTRLVLSLPGDGDAVLECDVAANAFAELGAKEGGELPLALRPDALRVVPGGGLRAVALVSAEAGAPIPEGVVRHRFGREDAVRWALVAGFGLVLYLFIVLPMGEDHLAEPARQ